MEKQSQVKEKTQWTIEEFLFVFVLIGFPFMQGWTVTMRHGVKRKRRKGSKGCREAV